MLESDAKRTYVAQSGLIGLNGPDSSRSGRPMYDVEKQHILWLMRKQFDEKGKTQSVNRTDGI
jgi:YidC/Oxa1 family membrane protein insertase